MKRCKHQLAPLCPRPSSTPARLQYLFCPYPGWLVCKHCGRIGWTTIYRGRLSWLRRESEDRVRKEAAEWNAHMAKLDEGER